MASETLTAAVLGLNESGRRMLKAAATGAFRIMAVADQDQQKVEKTAAEYGCEGYCDYRQLIVQNQLDCLLVAAETHTCDEHVETAMKRKFNILKLPPPARTFEEALEYVRLAEGENVRFAVANAARFRSSYVTAHELIRQGRIEHAFLVAARGTMGAAERPAWQTDPKLAGGGVLLYDGYQVVDQILWDFPIPEQVYALVANQAPDKQQRLYLTEDTALVCMKFSEALMGSLTVTRRNEIGPSGISIEIHGKGARLTVTDHVVLLDTHDGRGDRRWQYDEDEQVITDRLLASFAHSLRAPGEYEFPGGAAENLRNMAVFESAYLSARTGFPEEPARILQMAGDSAGAATSI